MNEQPKTTRQELTSNGDCLVRVEGVSKIFCRSFKRSLHYGLLDSLRDIVPVRKRKHDENGEPILRKEEFWAVKDVSFELRRGECIGLIGPNGAGKTTLLKMLNGLIKPDKGRIEMHGRVGGLIALGAGFNPILTGRENIYVNGSILGLSKKNIEDKLDEIIDFSGIREFIDSPVQSYSSGMAVRLGFAVASSLNPDVLLLDEVLAVGDFRFRLKCFERIGSLMRKAAVIFVSHRADEVRGLCDHALYLSRGRCVYFGQVNTAFERHEIDMIDQSQAQDHYVNSTLRRGEFTAADTVEFGSSLRVLLHCVSTVAYRDLIVRVLIQDARLEVAGEWNSAMHSIFYDLPAESSVTINIEIASVPIRPGIYWLQCMLSSQDHRTMLIKSRLSNLLRITGPSRIRHLRQL
jgi:homopolymeric O-antigen transport system ATP-binding protein